MSSRALPLVYVCSGCSSVTQAVNHLVIDLDRAGRAEMSCISGVGGGACALVKIARSGRPILVLDGCVSACAKACLVMVGAAPDVHLVLNQCGAKKRHHADYSDDKLSAAVMLMDDAVNTLKHQPDTVGD